MWLKKSIVNALERACELTHWWPLYYMGCRLANWSSDLDERWGTGQWVTMSKEEERSNNAE